MQGAQPYADSEMRTLPAAMLGDGRHVPKSFLVVPAALLHELKRRGKAARFGVVSMCIGSGMGAAAVFETGGEVDSVVNVRAVAGQNNLLSRDAVV